MADSEKMKCIDCGGDLTEEQEKEVRVSLSNPKMVKGIGKIRECLTCHQEYASEEESLRLMEAFERDRIQSYLSKKLISDDKLTV